MVRTFLRPDNVEVTVGDCIFLWLSMIILVHADKWYWQTLFDIASDKPQKSTVFYIWKLYRQNPVSLCKDMRYQNEPLTLLKYIYTCTWPSYLDFLWSLYTTEASRGASHLALHELLEAHLSWLPMSLRAENILNFKGSVQFWSSHFHDI